MPIERPLFSVGSIGQRKFLRQRSSAVMTRKQRIAIAEAISGKSSTITAVLVQVKCLATIKHSKTDASDTVVASMLNMVPSTADPFGDRACFGGGGFLFFVFFICAAIADPVGSGLFDPIRTLPVGLLLLPIVGCTIARPATEALKANGKRHMTASDGLRIRRAEDGQMGAQPGLLLSEPA